jgi:hypothetical protein
MATYHLHRWSITDSGNPYTPPESVRRSLVGFRDDDKKKVVTSTFIAVNGREVTTQSGSVYILEDIDPEYLEFLHKNGWEYDPVNPIKIREAK